MPRADILIESPIEPSFRVEQVRGMFDVPEAVSVKHEWHVNLPLEGKQWQIGLIVGPSGSGKTTIGRRLFPEALYHEGYKWPDSAAIVDGFPASLDGAAVTQALSSVGFSSPPHWLKRFSHLSNGQKFRCELARLMLEDADTVVFDEFTSVVDRDAAMISSAAVAKALRKRARPRLVALSCHFDIVDWLDPDWVYNVATGDFSWRLLRRRPPVELRINEATTAAWAMFRGHHYLTANLHKAARCFVATWRDKPVAFTSFMHFAHPNVRQAKREHRTVVLPDYQGVGIGNAVSEWLGAHAKRLGFRFLSTTSHPAMIKHRHRSDLWKVKRIGHVALLGKNSTMRRGSHLGDSGSYNRVTAGCEYVGPPAEPSAACATASSNPSTGSGVSPSVAQAPSTTGRRRKRRLRRPLTGRNRQRGQSR
jgi:GNAT superfamily N-acetyltransferase/alpha-D-ribose 1-methylphosphonate 5-triphosphate synthase subunit PhnL